MQELCANHASLLACLMGTPTAAANPTRHYHGTGIRLLSRSMDCSPCRSRAMVCLTARTQICCTIVLELVVLYSIPHPRATALHCRIAPCQLRPEPWSLRCLGRLVAWRFSVQPFAAMYGVFYHGYSPYHVTVAVICHVAQGAEWQAGLARLYDTERTEICEGAARISSVERQSGGALASL